MTRARYLFVLFLALPLAGCYADQKKQLATCETQATRQFPHPGAGQPFKAIQACMAGAGYRFIGWNEGVVCDMAAVVAGRPSATGDDVICFEPTNWLSRRLYRLEVPERTRPRAPG